MDRNSLSKSSKSNNTTDEPEYENVQSVAEHMHAAIELSGEAKAMGNESSIVSEPTCMVKKGTSLRESKANASKLTIREEIKKIRVRESVQSKSNVIQYLTYFSTDDQMFLVCSEIT